MKHKEYTATTWLTADSGEELVFFVEWADYPEAQPVTSRRSLNLGPGIPAFSELLSWKQKQGGDWRLHFTEEPEAELLGAIDRGDLIGLEETS